MKIFNIYFLLFILSFFKVTSASAQEANAYEKVWSTYYGGAGTAFLFGQQLSNGNIVVAGEVSKYLQVEDFDAYYNQFITSEAPAFQFYEDLNAQTVLSEFSPEGDLVWAGYYPFVATALKVDEWDDLYLSAYTHDSTLGTSNAWKSEPFDSTTSSFNIALKLTAENQDYEIDWLTYLPINTYPLMAFGGGSMFCVGQTTIKEGITTSGTFQPDFTGGNQNGYIVKLNLDGEMVWGQYTGQSYIFSVSYVRTRLVISGKVINLENNYSFASADAYQPDPSSSQFISVYAPVTGDRIYSTYYDRNLVPTSFHGVENSTEASFYVFGKVTGELEDTNLVSDDAFQTEPENLYTYYLGKLDVNMEPIWGTYIGGDQMNIAYVSNFSALNVKEDAIYVIAPTLSNTFFDSPNPYQLENKGENDLLMMKFSLEGDLIWGSFFGGEKNEHAGAAVVETILR